jgi:type II secretory pathway component PulF
MRANLSRAVRKIRLGQTLSQSLQGKLPAIAMQMIRTGEETGNLDTALHHVAEYYQRELEHKLHGLQTKLRPLSVSAIAALIAVVSIQSLRTLLNSLPN